MTATLPRRAVLAALLLLTPQLAIAAGKGGEAGVDFYAKLQGIVVEYWDAEGLFHVVNMDLTVVFTSQTSVNKKVADKITAALSAMAWEDFAKGNPAATVKAVALDVLRKDPSTANAAEVLVAKLMMR